MARVLAIVTWLGVTLLVTAATADIPFGGDDFGTIPSGKTTLQCEDSIAKAFAKAVSCMGKCTAARADGKLADDTAEDVCENNNAGKSCLEKFAATATKAQSKDATGGCNCIDVNALKGTLEGVFDAFFSGSYCDTTSGTPFGGDDPGDLPVAGSPVAKCEDSVTKLAGKAFACVMKCHIGRATGKLSDDTAEDGCEANNAGKSCLEKFQASVAKLTACPPCINAAATAGQLEVLADKSFNPLIYCGTATTTTSTTSTTLPCPTPDATGCCQIVSGPIAICLSAVGESGNTAGAAIACQNQGGDFASGVSCDQVLGCPFGNAGLVGCCTFDTAAGAPYTCSHVEVLSDNPGAVSGTVESLCDGAEPGSFAYTNCVGFNRCDRTSPAGHCGSWQCLDGGDCLSGSCVSSSVYGGLCY
jgi:hypothetical protein